jgi:hypothetical protein
MKAIKFEKKQQLIRHIEKTKVFYASLLQCRNTKEITKYEYIGKQGKFYMFKGKGGYLESFTAEQVYQNYKFNLEEKK